MYFAIEEPPFAAVDYIIIRSFGEAGIERQEDIAGALLAAYNRLGKIFHIDTLGK